MDQDAELLTPECRFDSCWLRHVFKLGRVRLVGQVLCLSREKITGSNPVHVTTSRRDLSKAGTMFLIHEIRVQLLNCPILRRGTEAARGRAHTGTRFLNGITQVGFLPG